MKKEADQSTAELNYELQKEAELAYFKRSTRVQSLDIALRELSIKNGTGRDLLDRADEIYKWLTKDLQ